MGKSSNSRQKLAFRAARRRVLAPHLRSSLLQTIKPLYESAGLIPPTEAAVTEKPGKWNGVEVVPTFRVSEKGRVLKSIHRVKEVEMEESVGGLVDLKDRVRQAEEDRQWKEENRMRGVVMRKGTGRGRKGKGGIAKRRTKVKHPKNKPSIRF